MIGIEPIMINELPIVIPDFWAVMTIIQEASGEGLVGMQAVGEVIRTRKDNKIFSDGTVAGTVLWPYQFSGWNTKDPNRIRVANMRLDDEVTLAAIKAWKMSKSSFITKGSTHYLNPSIVTPLPDWANTSNLRVVIGSHNFYMVN